LPGLYQFIDHKEFDHLSTRLLLPVLESWLNVRKKVLSKILHTAIRSTEHTKLLTVCESALANWNAAEPGRYILWLATAFLLAPDKFDMTLLEYTGRSKEKIIPLIDFVYLIFNDRDINNLQINNQALATLLRIIAPKVTPQEDRYGQICDNTRKVMFLFYQLAISTDKNEPETAQVIKQLNQVRVMKLYTPILDFVANIHESSKSQSRKPGFEEFISELISHDLIKAKIKRYD
jgi:hypothetical protein